MSVVPNQNRLLCGWRLFFILAGIMSLGIAQPLLELLGSNSEFFVIQRSSPAEVVSLAILYLLLPPIIVWITWAALNRIHSKLAITLAVVLACAPLVCFIAKRLLPGWDLWLLPLSLIGALLLTYLILKVRFFGELASLIAYAPLIILLYFLGRSDIRVILIPPALDIAQTTDSSSQHPVPTVVVIFDELPLVSLMNERNEIDSARFPSFGALAATSTWYNNSTSVSAWTQHAVPAILTGQLPQLKPLKKPWAVDHPVNLFTSLAPTHELRVFEQQTQLCPEALCKSQNTPPFSTKFRALARDSYFVLKHLLLPPSLLYDTPDISTSWGDFAKDTPDRKLLDKKGRKGKGLIKDKHTADDEEHFLRFVASVKRSDRPTLDFVHISFPHVPFRYLPNGQKYLRGADKDNDKGFQAEWGPEEWPTLQHLQRHLLQLKFTDVLLGKLLDKLRSEGMFDEVMLVVTADHGSSFQPGHFGRRADAETFRDIGLVPLFIKLPGQTAAKVDSRNSLSIDVLPTILAVQGINSPKLDGSSLLGTDPDRNEKPYYEIYQKENEHRLQLFGPQVDPTPSVRRLVTNFASGAGEENLYRLAARPELQSKPCSTLVTISDSNLRAELTNPTELEKVKLKGEFIPALITGKISTINSETNNKEKLPNKLDLAVCLNNQVATSTTALLSGSGNLRFSAIVNPDLIHEGQNSVEVIPLKNK